MSSYEIAKRCIGIVEIPGAKDHPMITWAYLVAGAPWLSDDKDAWCGASRALWGFLAGEAIPAMPARARSWLNWGAPVPLTEPQIGDTVILMRGEGPQPGPEVIKAPGHVCYWAGGGPENFIGFGGNQHNSVSTATFETKRILGIRRNLIAP